jgi:hypothetical protein
VERHIRSVGVIIRRHRLEHLDLPQRRVHEGNVKKGKRQAIWVRQPRRYSNATRKIPTSLRHIYQVTSD